jgi:hypothetical protein
MISSAHQCRVRASPSACDHAGRWGLASPGTTQPTSSNNAGHRPRNVARCRLANIQSQWLILKPRARHAAMLLSSADQDQAPAITASRLSFVRSAPSVRCPLRRRADGTVSIAFQTLYRGKVKRRQSHFWGARSGSSAIAASGASARPRLSPTTLSIGRTLIAMEQAML